MLFAVLFLLIAAVAIWQSTGFAIEAVERLTYNSKIAKVTLLFLVIGVVTSFPEIAVLLNSVALHEPQIPLGNLIGSQLFILFLVVPVLAIASGGLQLKTQMRTVSLALTLLMVVVPIVALLDQRLEIIEVLITLGLYFVFIITFARQRSFLERISERLQHPFPINTWWEVGKLTLSVLILLLASNTAVREIIEIAAVLQIPRFLMSLLLLPIATNLPELSLALGSLRAGKKDWALGDYLGSLTFNSLLLAILAISLGGSVVIDTSIRVLILFFGIGILIFWLACRSKEWLAVKEGLALLAVYAALVGATVWGIISFLLSR